MKSVLTTAIVACLFAAFGDHATAGECVPFAIYSPGMTVKGKACVREGSRMYIQCEYFLNIAGISTPIKVGVDTTEMGRHSNGNYSFIAKRTLGRNVGGKLVIYANPEGGGKYKLFFRVEAITPFKRVYLPGPSHKGYAITYVRL